MFTFENHSIKYTVTIMDIHIRQMINTTNENVEYKYTQYHLPNMHSFYKKNTLHHVKYTKTLLQCNKTDNNFWTSDNEICGGVRPICPCTYIHLYNYILAHCLFTYISLITN